MAEKENAVENAKARTESKETLKGKMIRWAITLVLCVGIFKLVTGLQSEQKQTFFDKARSQAMAGCQADRECFRKIQKYFDDCISGNYSSYRSGKFKRKYTLDIEGFSACIEKKP